MAREETPFLQQVRKDFEDVILNTQEFGRTCSWNGEPLQIVEDAMIDTEAVDTHGVNVERKIVYCRDVDLSPWPVPFEAVMFDNEPWTVMDVRTPFAHLAITLERKVS